MSINYLEKTPIKLRAHSQQAALDHLRAHGEVIKEEDEARLSPLGRKHINFLGHFSFSLPQVVEEGSLRALNVDEEQELVWCWRRTKSAGIWRSYMSKLNTAC